MTLRAGVIGVGMMGRHHVRVLRHLPGVQLVGVADPGGDRHRAATGMPVVASVEDLLALGVDYCVVATPTSTHPAIGTLLAAAGVPTLIEKPLAATLEHARALVAAFAATRTYAVVGHIERYNPAIRALREHLAVGELGEIYQVATRRHGPFPARVADAGVVMDLATHDIDILTHITGRAVVSVTARTLRRAGRPHEDLLTAICELDSGTIGTHHVSWLSPLRERVAVVTGERGCLVADALHNTLTAFPSGITRMVSDRRRPQCRRRRLPTTEPLVAEHEALRDALLGLPAAVITAREALATVAVAEAMLVSARSGTAATPATGLAAVQTARGTPSSR